MTVVSFHLNFINQWGYFSIKLAQGMAELASLRVIYSPVCKGKKYLQEQHFPIKSAVGVT